MSTGRSTGPAISSPPTSSAPTPCWRRRCAIATRLPAGRRDGFRFLHVSTDEVYGDLADGTPADERARYRPSSPYAATKAGADHLARAWHRTYGLPVIVTNCCNNYGPYQFPEKLIPTIILAGLHDEPLPVYGEGLNVRDWLHVDDHAAALSLILRSGRPGETYNVTAQTERRNIDVVKAICAALDDLRPDAPHRPHEQLIRFVTDRPGHDLRYALDGSEAVAGAANGGRAWPSRTGCARPSAGTSRTAPGGSRSGAPATPGRRQGAAR